LSDTSPAWLLEQVRAAPPRCIPLLSIDEHKIAVDAGQTAHVDTFSPKNWSEVEAGRAAADCVRWAAGQALAGHASALVTAPLNKAALAAAGETFPGHTELLQAQAVAHSGRSLADTPVRMMLANTELRVVLDSIHISLRQAIDELSTAQLLQTLQITHRALHSVLGRAPRIAVAGLNPHAGEGGLMGAEEQTTIAPAIAQAQAQGIDAWGPYAPDTIFMRARGLASCKERWDVVVALYHDQGLIPVKYMGLDEGVNVTLGLPLVRTSPDHGTAFDIAGKGLADPASMLAALRMARVLAAQ
jgi:4-hydroxythreonine-4-phosphate dehydrogenase